MTKESLEDYVYRVIRELNSSSDPRVGSARDNATTVSPLRTPTAGTNSSSVSTLFMTFIPVTIYTLICIILFMIFRRTLNRVYAPRTFLGSLEPHERTAELPSGWVKWFNQFWHTPDKDVLNHSSIDGFLFLRYLRVLIAICSVGCILTWPILLPLHAHGGEGNTQLETLTFANVKNPAWCLVHAFLAWIYFGFILYMVARECVYFINLRQAYLLSPYYADRLSSRTVLFTCVPQQILDEKKLRRVFGDAVKNVWIPRDTDELEQLVSEREHTAYRLEAAEIQLIMKTAAAHKQALKNGHPDIASPPETPGTSDTKNIDNIDKGVNIDISPLQSPISETPMSPREFSRLDGTPITCTSYGFDGPPPDVNGSVAAQWIPASQRPHHRPLTNYGRRVDTIKWSRNRLKELAPQISKLRREYKRSKGTPIPAAFIEFHTQVDAQAAYQTLAHHRADHMTSEIVGVRPEEIVWSSLYLSWYERIVRRFLIQGFIACMVIFWSLPAALVGIISNVKFLSGIFFLKWIPLLPSFILSLISGLLPAIALSLLMACVPIVMRACARMAGVPTESKIELFVQNAYFVFQVVQVFLITTLTSAASAAFSEIISNPMAIRTILSTNLPKASNFYISYFILQGLALSSTRIVHLGGIFRHHFLANSGNNPRLISKRYHRLRKIHWGSIFPVFTNMGVIAISYSLIAPIVLGVATIGFYVIYLTYKYNLLYVYSGERSARGLFYPRALMQTLTGVYLAEICLIGLFSIKGAYGAVVLLIGLLIFSALVHISLNDALSPLLHNLPRTLAAEEELRKSGNDVWRAENLEDKNDNNSLDGINIAVTTAVELDTEHPPTAPFYDSDFDPSDPHGHNNPPHGEQSSRSRLRAGPGFMPEGTDRALNLTGSSLKYLLKSRVRRSPLPKIMKKLDFWTSWISPSPTSTKPSMLIKFLHPEIFSDYHILRDKIPSELLDFEILYGERELRDAYAPPAMRKRKPRIWLPRDRAGVSTQEVRHCIEKGGVEARDEGAWVAPGDKGGVVVDFNCEVGRWVLGEEEGGCKY